MHEEAIVKAVGQVARSGWYLQGRRIEAFERQYAGFTGTRHCVSTGNGLDALTLIFKALLLDGRLQEGDEVLVPANTYIATILSITACGLKPVFVEPGADDFQIDSRLIEPKIGQRTRALMIVHLYGKCAYNGQIERLVRKHGLLLLEDNAQAHGCQYCDTWQGGVRKRRTGSLSLAAAHSFYPGKNLGALADAGCVTTDDDTLARMIRALANYGSSQKYVFQYKGVNSRMDEMSAAVLSVKLPFLDHENALRQAIARRYILEIANHWVQVPDIGYAKSNVFHIFPLLSERRDRLKEHLQRHGVGTMIHYPIAPHRQACYKEYSSLNLPITERIHHEELSLPINPALTRDDVDYIISMVNSFKG